VTRQGREWRCDVSTSDAVEARIRATLRQADELLWFGYAGALASARTHGASRRLVHLVIGPLRHLCQRQPPHGADTDSEASSLPWEHGFLTLAIGLSGLTWFENRAWDRHEPVRVMHHVPVSDVESIEECSRGVRTTQVRLRFTDGSHLDLGVVAHPDWDEIDARFRAARAWLDQDQRVPA